MTIPPHSNKHNSHSPIRRFWRWLTSPSSKIESRERYRQAYLLTMMLVVLIPLFVISLVTRSMLDGSPPLYMVVSLILLVCAYGFSRSQYFRTGIFILLTVFIFIPYSAILSYGYDPERLLYTLIWIIPTVLLAVLLLPLRDVILVLIFNLFLMLLLPIVASSIDFVHIIYPFAYVSIVVLMMFAVASVREKDLQRIKTQAAELAHSNQYLEHILDSIDSPFYVINVADYKIEMANKVAQDLGIDSSVTMPTCYKLTHHRDTPCDGLEHPCPLARVRETRKPTVVEHVHLDKHGQPRIMEVHGYPILDENGNVTQMIEYSLDITERREAEESVRKLSRAVEQSGNVIVITDINGIIEYVNPTFTSKTGFSEEEAIGNHTRILKSGKHDKDFYDDLWETLERGDVWQGEMINRKKNGELYWEHATMSPVKDGDGQITHFIAVKEDITQQKAAEEEIRKLSRAVEQSGSSIVITTLDGDIEYVNPAFTVTTGYTFAEAMGQNPRILKSENQSPELYTDLWQTISGGKVWQGELLNKKKNEDLYWEFATISPVKDEEGQVTHYLAIKDDITQRKQMEQDLALARDEALEASRLKTQLLANVSHDMRTPLGSILGYSEMLSEGIYGDVSEKQKSALGNIMESGGQLLLFINNMIDRAQIESGKIVLKPQPFAPDRLLDALESSVGALVQMKGLELTMTASPDLPNILIGDPYWLRQIISNLLSNAVKFTDAGGVRVSLQPQNDRHWAIEVTDSGQGIAQEDQSAIFDAFQQIDGTIQVQGSGSGLGLSIVKELTKLMNGETSLVSEVGQGSTFTILLPIITEEENSSEKGSES